MKQILFTLALLAMVASAEDPKPTVESLQSRISELEQQIVQLQKQSQVDLAICSGALSAARQVAIGQPQQPQRPAPKMPEKPASK